MEASSNIGNMKTFEEMKNDYLIMLAVLEDDIKIAQDAIEKMKKTILTAKTIDDFEAADNIIYKALEKTHYLDLRG